jgi:phosphoglycerol transferase
VKPAALLTKLKTDAKAQAVAVAALVVLVGYILMSRVTGNLPDIMGDELVYSTATLHQQMSAAGIPDYLYYWVYGSVGQCGIGFYACSQVLNTAFSMGAGVLLFSIASRFAPTWASAFIALFFVLGPLSAYNSYFMPESMYFFFFALLIWNITRPNQQNPLWFWAGNGALLGLLSLVKPHGVLLIPGICTYLLVVAIRDGKGWIGRLLRDAISFVASALIVKLLLGMIFAGPAGLTIFGSAYTGQPNALAPAHRVFAATTASYLPGAAGNGSSSHLVAAAAANVNTGVPFVIGQIGIQLLAVILVSALPLMAAIGSQTVKTERETGARALSDFNVLILSLLGWMIPLIAVFANITTISGEDTANRVMLRYYEFLIPLLLISLVGIAKDGEVAKPAIRWGLAIAGGALTVVGFTQLTSLTAANVPAWNLQFADSALLKVLIGTSTSDGQNVHWLAIVVMLLTLGALVTWAVVPKLAAKVWIAGALPLIVLLGSNALVANPVWRSNTTLPADTAGMFVRDIVPAGDLPNLVVVSSKASMKSELIAKFHINNADVQTASIDDGSAYAAPADSNIKWVVALGNVQLTDPGYVVAQAKGITVLRRDTGDITMFGNSSNYVSKLGAVATNLDKNSSVGMCATRTVIPIKFAQQLPNNAHIRVGISGSAGLPNEQVTIAAAAWSAQLTVNSVSKPADLDLQLGNVEPTDTVTFTLPNQPGAGLCLSYVEVVK